MPTHSILIITNYTVISQFIEKLGKGAQGVCHLVENTKDGTRVVLKQVCLAVLFGIKQCIITLALFFTVLSNKVFK